MKLDMICVCREEGVCVAENRRLRVQELLQCDYRDLIETVIMSLAFDFRCDANIAADMWFGVGVHTDLLTESIWVECDRPYDGLVAAWEVLAEKFPTLVTRGSKTSRIVVRVSESLLSNYVAAERKYRAHRESSHRDDNDCPPCEDCDVLIHLSIIAQQTLDDVWGAPVLDKAVERAFGGLT